MRQCKVQTMAISEPWSRITQPDRASRARTRGEHPVIADFMDDGCNETPSRFDGLYGAAYSAVIQRQPTRIAAGWMWGRGSAMSFLDDLLDNALAGLTANDFILDVPCGRGSTIREAAKRNMQARMASCDISSAMLDGAAPHAAHAAVPVLLARCDAGNLPFQDGVFQRAISINGLHCMPDPESFLAEIRRTLAPQSDLWMTTLVSSTSRRHAVINHAALRSGIIPAEPPTREHLEHMAYAAGFDRIEDLGGSGIAAFLLRTPIA